LVPELHSQNVLVTFEANRNEAIQEDSYAALSAARSGFRDSEIYCSAQLRSIAGAPEPPPFVRTLESEGLALQAVLSLAFDQFFGRGYLAPLIERVAAASDVGSAELQRCAITAFHEVAARHSVPLPDETYYYDDESIGSRPVRLAVDGRPKYR
jgi:hypothetical protein